MVGGLSRMAGGRRLLLKQMGDGKLAPQAGYLLIMSCCLVRVPGDKLVIFPFNTMLCIFFRPCRPVTHCVVSFLAGPAVMRRARAGRQPDSSFL